MKDELVKFETAKLAKEKRFDVIQRFGVEASLYDNKGKHTYYANYGFMYSGLNEGYISAPTQSLLQRWLREEHNIHIVIRRGWGKPIWYDYVIETTTDAFLTFENQSWSTYEEALEEGLKQALELI